jgi:hypothetical protein
MSFPSFRTTRANLFLDGLIAQGGYFFLAFFLIGGLKAKR